MPEPVKIQDRCPSCGARSLFIGDGGWLTCSVIGCNQPGVSAVVEDLQRLRRVCDSETNSFGFRFFASQFEQFARATDGQFGAVRQHGHYWRLARDFYERIAAALEPESPNA